jgi:hypothetical protein
MDRRTILAIGVCVLGGLAISAGTFYWLSYDAWQYVLNNQWIKDPLTHYEGWEFIFAREPAWAWLWYTNYSAWVTWALVLSVVAGFIGAFLIAVIIANV